MTDIDERLAAAVEVSIENGRRDIFAAWKARAASEIAAKNREDVDALCRLLNQALADAGKTIRQRAGLDTPESQHD